MTDEQRCEVCDNTGLVRTVDGWGDPCWDTCCRTPWCGTEKPKSKSEIDGL